VDNAAFTIASAANLLFLANDLQVQQGMAINQTWNTQAKNINFPRAASNITLEFETMNNSVVVKQADVVLLTYPLDYGQNYTAADKLMDLDYVSFVRELRLPWTNLCSTPTSSHQMGLL
jgi:trehalose/maltose hydrolase-like predicted phosphorylase